MPTVCQVGRRSQLRAWRAFSACGAIASACLPASGSATAPCTYKYAPSLACVSGRRGLPQCACAPIVHGARAAAKWPGG